jgi:hypothetical protein
MREKLRRELVGCLIKEFGGDDTTTLVDDNAHDEFVDVVLTEIDNYTKKLNGNTTQLRFHPLIMRVATNLYMSSSSAYMDLQKSSIFALPSESTMKEKKSEGSVKDGKNVLIICFTVLLTKKRPPSLTALTLATLNVTSSS